MKRTKIIKLILLISFILIVFFGFKNLYTYFFSGKQAINLRTSSQFYAGSNLEAIVSVEKIKTNKLQDSNLKLELLDSNDKKVKDVKYSGKIKNNDEANISIKLPENLEKGSYNLVISARSGLYYDVAKQNIEINPSVQSEAIISLDKGIYKPGDEINYRTLAVSKRDNKPLDTEISMYIYDGNDNKVYSETAKTSDFGIVSGTFKLADEVNSGTYRICANINGKEVNKYFKVNPYITPKFEVSVLTDKDNYIVGDVAEITIACKYFFGEPVANASVGGTINNEAVQGLTDPEGNFKYSYKMTETGKINLDFTVTDTSKYMIDQKKEVYCGTDYFEIEVLPEFGDIYTNVDNDIYVFTKTASGVPVKTYSTITFGTYSKQLISDESGIGKVTFTKNEIGNYNSKKSTPIKIEAKDMEEHVVAYEANVNIKNDKHNLIKTDKVKYDAGEDINVEAISKIDSATNSIFVCKGKELVKTITFEGNETKFNLDNITGLVDIYISSNYSRNYYSSYDNLYTKRTIFVKPNKDLKININLEKEEYKPGDTLKVKFETKDENNVAVDTALLVSILDEAVLNLENNDLSVDNIKIALEDVKLAEGITAADLYASAIGEKSETLLMGVLLRQNNVYPNIIDRRIIDYSNEDNLIKAIILIVIAIIIMSAYCIYKFEKVRKFFQKFIVAVINIIAIFILLILLIETSDIHYDLYRFLGYSNGIVFLSLFSISVISYVLILYKFEKEIFKFICQLFVPFVIVMLIMAIYEMFFYGEDWFIALLIIFALVLFTCLTVLKRNNKLKNKALIIIYNILIWLLKFLVLMFIIYLLIEVAELQTLGFIIGLGLYVIFEIFVFGKMDGENSTNNSFIQDGKIILNVTPIELMGMALGVGLILLVVLGLGMYIYNSASATINSSMESMSSSPIDYYDYDYSSTRKDATGISGTSSETRMTFSDEASEAVPNSNPIKDLFSYSSSIKSDDQNTENITAIQNEETVINQNEENVVKVRNVFLESLAFIPELIAKNGEVDAEIPISDNITTWSIQTVGNTKNGNIGYANSSFKVFKDYFVDFSLPTNAVVGDKVSIPLTIYNYTEEQLNIDIVVKENDWCIIGNYTKNIAVNSKETKMIYIPIEIIKEGNNTLRIETKAGNKTDIVEKNFTVKVNGLEVEKMVSSGIITDNYSMDILYDEKYIDGTGKLKLKIYPSAIIQTIDNIEAMLELPTGCFEQTSSSLYPDILVLKYLQENNLSNDALREKALDYISKGYQKLLTYEVPETKGGYSLYGNSPAEPVITAFGLMEFNELKEVYDVDENVIDNMKEYLFSVQKIDGTFNYSSTYIGGAEKTDKIAMNAYIVWALSEVCPEDSRLEKSIKYLENKLDKTEDNYTIALIANILANTKGDSSEAIKILMSNIKTTENGAYIESRIRDYYGSYGRYQNIQTTALTSLALSKLKKENKNNSELVNYLVASKCPNGTWGTTQNTILALKAVNEFSANSDISKQSLTINFNNKSNSIDIKDDVLDVYEIEFDNVQKENKLSIGMKKGKLIYEVIKDYYIDYSDIEENNSLIIDSTLTESAKVNDELIHTIFYYNNSNNNIENGLIRVNIPQGTTVIEDSLLKLKYEGVIEKYEYNYGSINIYLRNVIQNIENRFEIKYRALYPEEITGGAIRFYDYYNPEIEAISEPTKITIK